MANLSGIDIGEADDFAGARGDLRQVQKLRPLRGRPRTRSESTTVPIELDSVSMSVICSPETGTTVETWPTLRVMSMAAAWPTWRRMFFTSWDSKPSFVAWSV